MNLATRITGKERDTETGLDYFGARYYASNMGRWMSPDWAANATAVPYAQFGDPQTLNLYGYVRNNPLGTADLDGHGEWYDVKGKHLGTDGVDNGAVVVANGKVSYSSDHSLIDMSSSDKPLASFSKAEGAAMHDAVDRSNAPTSDDKTGGMHEEGFATTKGQITNAPAGAAYKPGNDHIQITVPTTADTTLKVHVHPEGRGNVQVQQTPSDPDRNNVDPMARPNMTNVVVGAGSGKVYIYDQKGTKAEIPLKVFPKDKE